MVLVFGRSLNQLKPMTNFQKTVVAALGGVAVLYTAAVIAAPAKQKAVEGNHANYASHWLLIQTTTAPAFEDSNGRKS